MCAYVPTELEDGGEVHLENRFPVAVWELVRWVPPLDSTAVEEDVDPVAVLEYGGSQGGDGGGGGEISGVDGCFTTERLDGLFCLLIGGITLGKCINFFSSSGRSHEFFIAGLPEPGEYLLLLLRGRWPLLDQSPEFLL